MSNHIHGRPDSANQDDDGFDLPHLDHPYLAEEPATISLLETIEHEHPIRWIGKDKAIIQRQVDTGIHWSEREELGYIGEQQAKVRDPWEYGDNNAQSPEEAGWDNHNG